MLGPLFKIVTRWDPNKRPMPPLSADLDDAQTSAFIASHLLAKTPVLASRLGWEEARALEDFSRSPEWAERIAVRLGGSAGMFPSTRQQLSEFCEEYQASLPAVDLLALMRSPFETKLIRRYADKSKTCELTSLEPYFSGDPWSRHLSGLKVLVIHPFAESIQKQYHSARKQLFSDPRVLPEFSLRLIKPPQTMVGNTDGFASWTEALSHLKQQVADESFDVAIAGCGAYGLPIGAFIKQMGKSCIHLGGATQLLFGISGARWREQPTFQALMSDAWRPPLESERPPGWENVEKGCYW